MTIREKIIQEGRDAFSDLVGYCIQDPYVLNPLWIFGKV